MKWFLALSIAVGCVSAHAATSQDLVDLLQKEEVVRLLDGRVLRSIILDDSRPDIGVSVSIKSTKEGTANSDHFCDTVLNLKAPTIRFHHCSF
ncbi:MAG: hypothetical protein KDD25_06130 [Bdellovibrionales bacterium]|nr:hypothetical protein [Bdellovibrionales bacterium]